MPPYRVLTLDDVEAVPGPASLAWRPLRAELGLRAFGVSSFVAAGNEWMWRVRHLLPDQVERARALADAGLAELPDRPGIWYVQALVAAAERHPEAARKWLAKAAEREPGLLDEARAELLLADVA